MARVTLLGRAPDGWRSVEATREFFRRTLDRSHDLTSSAMDCLPTEPVAVLVNFYAATATEDTLLLGFGLEQLATDEERAALVGQALDGLSE